jgi:hypothetical protein
MMLMAFSVRMPVIVPLVLFILAVTALVAGLIIPVSVLAVANVLIPYVITGCPTSLALGACYCRCATQLYRV